jgi:hypothetical protein
MMLIFSSALLVVPAAALTLDRRIPEILPPAHMNAAVSLAVTTVGEDGAIEGTLSNNTGRKIGDVEVLVEYAWIWARDFAHDDDPGWSTSYTLPVELSPGASIPVNIAPTHPLAEREDGHFLISAKVIGFTRYRWASQRDLE